MNKIDALEKSVEMWRWLAEDGLRQKIDWPGHTGDRMPISCCYLCRYTMDLREDCTSCPMYGHWPDEVHICHEGDSAYNQWESDVEYNISTERRAEIASELAEAMEQRLEELKNE